LKTANGRLAESTNQLLGDMQTSSSRIDKTQLFTNLTTGAMSAVFAIQSLTTAWTALRDGLSDGKLQFEEILSIASSLTMGFLSLSAVIKMLTGDNVKNTMANMLNATSERIKAQASRKAAAAEEEEARATKKSRQETAKETAENIKNAISEKITNTKNSFK
jgi:ribosomal protein L12E/L44/L45/RPP1/RPP2